MRILIIEDEKSLREDVVDYLSENGYKCDFATTVKSSMQKLSDTVYSCALIDVGLPDGSGIEIVEYIKKQYPEMGVIIVTAKNALEDKITGLKIGADDYLTKPFHLSELSARIYSILRRRNFGGKNALIFEGLEIDTTEKKVMANQQQMQLTKKEYDILVYLASNPTHLITKEALADAIWGDKAEMASSFDFVYSQIKNLKKKLNEAGLKDYIKVVYGMGYKFKDQ
ncbi:MAG: response regulator transcription factor [Bacteroidota bacterium]